MTAADIVDLYLHTDPDDELALIEANVEQLGRYRPTDDQTKRMKALNAVQITAHLDRFRRRAHPSRA